MEPISCSGRSEEAAAAPGPLYRKAPTPVFGPSQDSADRTKIGLLAMFGVALEVVGADQAVRLGDPAVWRAAVAG